MSDFELLVESKSSTAEGNLQQWLAIIECLYHSIQTCTPKELFNNNSMTWGDLLDQLGNFLKINDLIIDIKIHFPDKAAKSKENTSALTHQHKQPVKKSFTPQQKEQKTLSKEQLSTKKITLKVSLPSNKLNTLTNHQHEHIEIFQRLATQAINHRYLQEELESEIERLQQALIFQLSSTHLSIVGDKQREGSLRFLAPSYRASTIEPTNLYDKNKVKSYSKSRQNPSGKAENTCFFEQLLNHPGNAISANRIYHINPAKIAQNDTFNQLAIELRETYQLTLKEITLALLISQGISIKKISSLLSRSENTLRSQLKSIYKKIGKNHKIQLTQIVINTLRKHRLATIARYYQTVILPAQANSWHRNLILPQ